VTGCDVLVTGRFRAECQAQVGQSQDGARDAGSGQGAWCQDRLVVAGPNKALERTVNDKVPRRVRCTAAAQRPR
jgi:hypothetical protein